MLAHRRDEWWSHCGNWLYSGSIFPSQTPLYPNIIASCSLARSQKPGFLNNTFANFVKRPHAKAWGYTNKAHLRGLKSLQAAEAAFESNSDTLGGCGLFGEGIIKETRFLAAGFTPTCRAKESMNIRKSRNKIVAETKVIGRLKKLRFYAKLY